jgi:ABC-type multidrug transport system fused ATPase/permease subunit
MLSGGQRQKIAIARALAYEAQILLLDEATSALDNNSEKIILSNIKKVFCDKTIVSIAHRLSAVEAADEILVIEQGKVEAMGIHNQLLHSSPTYALLYNKQYKKLA